MSEGKANLKKKELNYLENLPPTEKKNSVQRNHVVYLLRKNNAEKLITPVHPVMRSQPFV